MVLPESIVGHIHPSSYSSPEILPLNSSLPSYLQQSVSLRQTKYSSLSLSLNLYKLFGSHKQFGIASLPEFVGLIGNDKFPFRATTILSYDHDKIREKIQKKDRAKKRREFRMFSIHLHARQNDRNTSRVWKPTESGGRLPLNVDSFSRSDFSIAITRRDTVGIPGKLAAI